MELRTAEFEDVPALEQLIARSVRGLQGRDYTPEQIEAALTHVFGLDRQLIEDRTYFLVEHEARVVGCGGWSQRATLFGGNAYAHRDGRRLQPGVDAAKIRAFFVHPDWARRGVATQLLSACETAAMSAGFDRLELGATLTGEPFYTRQGYVAAERLDVALSDSQITLAIVHMTKP